MARILYGVCETVCKLLLSGASVGHLATPFFLVSCSHASFGDSSTTSLCFLYGTFLESSRSETPIRAPNPGVWWPDQHWLCWAVWESNFYPSGDNLVAPTGGARWAISHHSRDGKWAPGGEAKQNVSVDTVHWRKRDGFPEPALAWGFLCSW